jgi:hypothetical protein
VRVLRHSRQESITEFGLSEVGVPKWAVLTQSHFDLDTITQVREVDPLPRSISVLLSPDVGSNGLKIALTKDMIQSANACLVLTVSEPQPIYSLPLTSFPYIQHSLFCNDVHPT